jgi:hypothetical protein
MEKVSKFLYETTVNKQIEEKVTEKRVENGETIEVVKTVKKVKPIKVAILRPDRKRSKEAEIFYAKRLSHYLREGLLPHSLISKRYLNDGGPLSEGEKNLIESLRQQHVSLQEEYFAMKSPLTEEQTQRRGVIIMEVGEIQRALRDIQANYSEVFSNTAEAKGRGDLLDWWVLFLSYADLDDKGMKSIYGDGDYETRMKILDEMEEKEDPCLHEVVRKLSYLISFWHTAGMLIDAEDFKSAEEDYNKNVSTYLVLPEEEKSTEPVVEEKPVKPVVEEKPKEAAVSTAAPVESAAPTTS